VSPSVLALSLALTLVRFYRLRIRFYICEEQLSKLTYNWSLTVLYHFDPVFTVCDTWCSWTLPAIIHIFLWLVTFQNLVHSPKVHEKLGGSRNTHDLVLRSLAAANSCMGCTNTLAECFTDMLVPIPTPLDCLAWYKRNSKGMGQSGSSIKGVGDNKNYMSVR